MKWNEQPLKVLCLKIGSGATPKGGNTVYISKGVSFIRSQNVYNLSFDYSGLVYIDDEASEKLKNVAVEKDDVLINITGDSVARTCIVPSQVLPARVNQHVAILRANPKILNAHYLNYYLASPYMQSYMLNLAVGKGASRNAMTKVMLENFTIPLPPLQVQQRIASILSRYDDLIENYQQQIKLLEETAQRLYKEWFVDLHFPGYKNTKIVDGVPEGWKTLPISGVCEKIKAGGTPSRRKLSYWKPEKYRWVKTKELQDNWIVDTEEHISEEGLNNSSAKLFPPKTILMAIYASPTLGRLGILNNAATCNQAALGLIVDEKQCSNYWLFLKLFELRDYFNSVARGAGQQNISADVVKNKEIICPNKHLMDSFTRITTPVFNNILSLTNQITLLAEARDRLLPKLMSGEIEV